VIVDSHAHIFEKWSGACGMPSRALHWRYIQKNLCRPAAKVFRYRDGAPSSAAHLFRAGTNAWDGLRDDIEFRIGPYGRIEFTIEGEDHYVQYMPAAMAQIESTPESMITQMNAAGVDHCVLQAGFTYGYMNDYNALAQRQYPGRFTGLFHVDEARADQAHWLAETRRAIEQLGLKGLYYQLEHFSRYGFDVWFDDRRFDGFWSLIEERRLPVVFEITPIPDYDRASCVEVFRRLGAMLDRYPGVTWVIGTAPPVQFFAAEGHWQFPAEVERVYRHDNTLLEICFPITWGGVWDYPFPEAQALLRDLRDQLGAEKLVWGSDMPNVERFCTYKQSLDYVRTHCRFLSAREMDQVLGGNLKRVFGNQAQTATSPER
jgi:predicted TIM-barrel fold metal-dependent hydrolase